MRTLEICCPTVASVDAAFLSGADRVELCCALCLDGLTPSAGLIEYAVGLKSQEREQPHEQARPWAVNVLIRPREGDFVYTSEELEVMVCDIEMAKKLGADGVVVGALTPEGDIDMEAMQKLMHAANGMSVTFHRAFDHGRDPMGMLENIITLGCDRLLTSGTAVSALEGKELLKKLVSQSNGRISIMAGAGIRPNNVVDVIAYTGVWEVHASAGGSYETMSKIRELVQ